MREYKNSFFKMSFLAEDGVERSSLRDLLELGHSLVAEIHRLSEMVPEDFINPSSSKFKPLIIDFTFFGDLSAIDKFVDTNEQGALLEDEFFFSFDKVIKRFGALFDSLANFLCDVVELSERDRFSESQSSFRPTEADLLQRQLKAEILFVAGVILIVFDEKFAFDVKQRLFIAHYRSNPASNERFDLLVDLMKRKPANLEQLFSSLPINKHFATSVVSSVRSDGLFMDECEFATESTYESRVTRTQRAVLFICLFFTPSVLHSDFTTMRQIVDMYFAENWVISLHIGVLVNVVFAWENFKAASSALHQAVTVASAKKLCAMNVSALKAVTFPHSANLSKTDFSQCHSLIANANLRLRWITLHSYKALKVNKRVNQLNDAVWSQMDMSQKELFGIVLEIANFEYKFKENYRKALRRKKAKFDELEKEICQHLSQMAGLFSNDSPLQKIKKNLKLQNWLLLMEKTVRELDCENCDASSLVEHLKRRIEEVSDIHDLSGNVAVGQYLQNVSMLFSELAQCCSLSEDFMNLVDAASDFSYGWTIVDQWGSEMEALVESDPLSIRSLFVKLSTSIGRTLVSVETPARISSISLCYSRQLEARLRKILQAVPRSLFVLLDRIASLLDSSLKSCVFKTELRQFADSERRLNLAASTYAISTLSLGISTMQLTWIGSLRIDPSALLLDGIKRELVSRISHLLHKELSASADISTILCNLRQQFSRFRDAFIYMCEHIAINGAFVWQSEMTRVIGYMQEKESNLFLKHAVTEEESLYQCKSVVIPSTPPIADSITPLGRLYAVYLKCSDPRSTRYVNSLQVWCDVKTKKTLLAQESFSATQDALSPMVLNALDRIACFDIVKHITTLCDLYSHFVNGLLLQSLLDLNSTQEAQPAIRYKFFDIASSRISPVSSPFSVIISKIGQRQLLRQRMLTAVKSNVCRNAFNVVSAVDSFQKGVLDDLRDRKGHCHGILLIELTELLQQCAMMDPLHKRYVRRECPATLSAALFSILVVVAPFTSGTKRPESVDLSMFCAGMACIITQFEIKEAFFSFANSYFVSGMISTQIKPNFAIVPALRIVAEYCSFELQELEKYIPAALWAKSP